MSKEILKITCEVEVPKGAKIVEFNVSFIHNMFLTRFVKSIQMLSFKRAVIKNIEIENYEN